MEQSPLEKLTSKLCS